MAPKLVIFDCDGVLVDTEGPANRRLAQWITEAGYPIAYEQCRHRFSGRSLSSVRAELIQTAGVDLGADLIERWYRELPELFSGGVEAIAYVRDFIAAVERVGLPLCVASSARIDKMHMTLGQTGLLPYFKDVLFSASMVEHGKPAPDLFLHAAKTMGIRPADCIVIEDSVPGTQAGVAAGMRVFSYHGDPMADVEGLRAAGGILFDDMRKLAGLVPLSRSASPGKGTDFKRRAV
ncbi:HAD family hydrolase [Mesorhizobium sp. Root157]|uniref:HAD family hydrolase n=1 Tax=Mesorhizobium sp. Root157 TaxID=1736477 RepID=UPI0006F75B1A|nr:HAD family phosphatase [Mesorhizobium sp. Root157]KQZ96092.1 HAD family hydrolase [Mesorhizobium sp. Root157]